MPGFLDRLPLGLGAAHRKRINVSQDASHKKKKIKGEKLGLFFSFGILEVENKLDDRRIDEAFPRRFTPVIIKI